MAPDLQDPTTAGGSGGFGGRRDRIRVATYNVRTLKGDRSALVRVIRALRPDVLCLQEVPRHVGSGHRVGDLADGCDLLWSGGGERTGGTAVLSSLRTEQIESSALALPVRALSRPRGMATALVALPGGPRVRVASVQLGPDPLERVRHAQLIIGRLRAAGPGPYVVGGDLGEDPGGAAWRVLAGEVRDAPGAAGLTYPARGPRGRVDAILCSDDVRVESIGIPGPHDDVDPIDLVLASDHLPVVADIVVSDPG